MNTLTYKTRLYYAKSSARIRWVLSFFSISWWAFGVRWYDKDHYFNALYSIASPHIVKPPYKLHGNRVFFTLYAGLCLVVIAIVVLMAWSVI